jgi:hypothetical protein
MPSTITSIKSMVRRLKVWRSTPLWIGRTIVRQNDFRRGNRKRNRSNVLWIKLPLRRYWMGNAYYV